MTNQTQPGSLMLTITTPSSTIVPSTHSCNSVNIGGPHTTHNVEKFLDLQISSRICRGGDGNTPSAIGREVQKRQRSGAAPHPATCERGFNREAK